MTKYNFSLRALALAVATLFVTTGCSEDSSTEEVGGGNSNAAIKIAVSNILGTSATVTTAPASSLTYKVDVVTKEEFDTHASAKALAEADLDAIKAEALAAGNSLAEYLVLSGLLKNGNKSETFSGLTVSTDYVAFAYGLSTEGEITSEVYTADFTTQESDPTGPAAKVLILAGKADESGENIINKATAVTVGVQLTNDNDVATAVYELFAPTKAIDAVLTDNNLTHADLIQTAIANKWEDVYTYSAKEVAFLNEKRLIAGSYSNMDPETSYTAIILVTGSNDISTVVYDSATTDNAGEPTEAYNAWLGTWTVTSTSSTYDNQALTFDITLYQRYAHHRYQVGGLTSSDFRDEEVDQVKDIVPTALFDEESGKFAIANQLIYSDSDEDGAYEFYYNLRYKSAADGKTYVNNQNNLIGLIGTLNADNTTGTITGNTLETSSGQATVEWMDYFFWNVGSDGNYTSISGCKPSQMFSYANGTQINYPIGPFTITKKTTTEPEPEPSPAPTPESIRKSAAPSMVHKLAKAQSVEAALQTSNSAFAVSKRKVFDFQHSEAAARLIK